MLVSVPFQVDISCATAESKTGLIEETVPFTRTLQVLTYKQNERTTVVYGDCLYCATIHPYTWHAHQAQRHLSLTLHLNLTSFVLSAGRIKYHQIVLALPLPITTCLASDII